MKAIIASSSAASTLMERDMENTPSGPVGRAYESKYSLAAPLPGSAAYEELPQFPQFCVLPFRRTIRRKELRQIVPLAETTIYEMERRGEFPRRFNLTPRCVVWDLAEVEAWIEQRKQAPRTGIVKPDVHQRKTRPVRADSEKI
ncbi:helix-turn-helix transcriptional regulator [Xanthomonas maliensis]|uniref:helix-turn-helix transcriptional regulator n=2 Tax=Xanthomonas maliensis TaxID=1321368 RepID=UPI001FD56481|nr:AlpA family phage regulatory protein [Xanthomonas maliensis]